MPLPPAELAVLDAIDDDAPEDEILECVAALEAQGRAAQNADDVLGSWGLVFTSSSKFDLSAPLGRRVDGTAPGLEGLFEIGSGDSSEPTAKAPSREASSSPIQRLVTRSFPSKQVITGDRINTVVDLAGLGVLTLSAEAEPSVERPSRLGFTFDEAFFEFGPLRLPYPVPFRLLGDEAKGWIETTYCSETLRVSRGNKGTVFVLRKQRPANLIILPGLGNDSNDYDVLLNKLNREGFSATVVPVVRLDWLRNALGLLDGAWWAGRLEPRPVLDWYLDRLSVLIDEGPEEGVTLLGHSAGGWLGRIVLGETGGRGVRRLVTLGTPHCPPLPDSEGSFDQTRGLLTYVQQQYKELPPNVEGITVIGRYIKGVEQPFEDPVAFVAGVGYKQVHGRGDVWGDGIIPEPSALLPGMKVVTLKGVYHSPLGASADRKWYGDDEFFDQWVQYLQ